MSKKLAIPNVPVRSPEQRMHFDRAVKHNLEQIAGLRDGSISSLASDASLADVIAKVNQIIEQLQ